MLGEPSLYDKLHLAQDFVIAAALTLTVEDQRLSSGSILEELLRVRGEDRWCFDDLSATLAGVTFATQLDVSPGLFTEPAASFRVADYALRPAAEPAVLARGVCAPLRLPLG